MLFTVLWDSLKFFFLGVEKMKKQYKSFLSYLALPCLLSTLSLRADDCNTGCNTGCKTEADDSCGMCKSSGNSTYDRIQGKEITPNAGPTVNCGADIFIEADYIYWYSSQDGLDYAATGVTQQPPIVSNNQSSCYYGHRHGIKGKMSSGFKVAGGLDLDYDGWDTLAQFTWLHVNSSNHHDSCSCTSSPVSDAANHYTILQGNFATEAAGVPLTSRNLFNNIANTVSGNWKLHFNVIDWELGRSFYISPKLVLRPHMGLKGTWQKQRYNVTYNVKGSAIDIGGASTSNSNNYPGITPSYAASDYSYPSTTEAYTIAQVQRYWGIGTRFGLDTSWMITKCFSIFGEVAASTVFGYFKDTRQDTSNVTNATTNTALITNYDAVSAVARRHQVNGVLETQIGLRYDYMFCDDEYRFRIQAGWENQLWFNQNHFIGNALVAGQGQDLGFQGFTLNVRFDF